MANAIKKISIQRGYDVTEYTLCCFGGAAAQHACAIADTLGIKQIFIPPLAGVLSAYGMGLADLRILKEQAIEGELTDSLIPPLQKSLAQLEQNGREAMERQGIAKQQLHAEYKAHIRYQGTDTPLQINFADKDTMVQKFEIEHRQRYGFIMPEKTLVVEAVSVEIIGSTGIKINAAKSPQQATTVNGPNVISEEHNTIVIAEGWQAKTSTNGSTLITQLGVKRPETTVSTKANPVMLEVFNNLFVSIAEQMGTVLRNTAYSVNIKERLDFSCAIFNTDGHLVANAPHIPVHLGSMSESVQTIAQQCGKSIKPGDVYMLNNPYNGGTHLPDVTVITPVFDHHQQPLFFVITLPLSMA